MVICKNSLLEINPQFTYSKTSFNKETVANFLRFSCMCLNLNFEPTYGLAESRGKMETFSMPRRCRRHKLLPDAAGRCLPSSNLLFSSAFFLFRVSFFSFFSFLQLPLIKIKDQTEIDRGWSDDVKRRKKLSEIQKGIIFQGNNEALNLFKRFIRLKYAAKYLRILWQRRTNYKNKYLRQKRYVVSKIFGYKPLFFFFFFL